MKLPERNFSAGKLGSVEASTLSLLLQDKVLSDNHLKMVHKHTGVLMSDQIDMYCWVSDMFRAIEHIDIVLQWCENYGDKFVLDSLNVPSSKIIHDFNQLEPFTDSDGWHKDLPHKRVLVVSPFKDTIMRQLENYHKIWGCDPLNYVHIAQCSFSSYLTGDTHLGYCDKCDQIKDSIDGFEFDVAIVGCGGFSLPICDFIKSNGGVAVHLGGATQVLFGIRGKRWDDQFKQYEWYGTDHWVRPQPHETPVQAKLLEMGCYW